MFAVVAAICFGVALILDLLNTGGEYLTVFALAGLLALAIHFVAPLPWRR